MVGAVPVPPRAVEGGWTALVFTDPVRFVSHMLSGITMETSRRTPDHRTRPLLTPVTNASLSATSARRSANGWSSLICPRRSELVSC